LDEVDRNMALAKAKIPKLEAMLIEAKALDKDPRIIKIIQTRIDLAKAWLVDLTHIKEGNLPMAPMGICWCGCGGKPSGRRSHWVSGHDTKLKNALARVEAGEIEISQIPNHAWVAQHILRHLPRCAKCGSYYVSGKTKYGPVCKKIMDLEKNDYSVQDI
jgi:hypothetical protein